MPKKGRKILLPDDAVAEEGIPVQRYFLDTNHHMNNGKYIMVAESYLPEDFKVASFRVEYRNQAHLGDILYPYVSIADGKVTVSLCDAAKSVYASLEFLS
jgi:acyl-ACP thioesterase